jgi:hypothetical protein
MLEELREVKKALLSQRDDIAPVVLEGEPPYKKWVPW